MISSIPDKTNCMDNILCFQIKTRCDHSRSGITMSNLFAGGLQLIMACRPEDYDANTVGSQKSIICGIRNRICI